MSDTKTETLASWLLRQIAEDEAVARAATPGPWGGQGGGDVFPDGPWARSPWEHNAVANCRYGDIDEQRNNAEHIARHDPARVLAVCAAHRLVVELHTGVHSCTPRFPGNPWWGELVEETCPTLRALATAYADRESFREEWR